MVEGSQVRSRLDLCVTVAKQGPNINIQYNKTWRGKYLLQQAHTQASSEYATWNAFFTWHRDLRKAIAWTFPNNLPKSNSFPHLSGYLRIFPPKCHRHFTCQKPAFNKNTIHLGGYPGSNLRWPTSAALLSLKVYKSTGWFCFSTGEIASLIGVK